MTSLHDVGWVTYYVAVYEELANGWFCRILFPSIRRKYEDGVSSVSKYFALDLIFAPSNFSRNTSEMFLSEFWFAPCYESRGYLLLVTVNHAVRLREHYVYYGSCEPADMRARQLVHGQVTIIFVVSVCLSVCLCRVFLSRLWSDFDETWT